MENKISIPSPATTPVSSPLLADQVSLRSHRAAAGKTLNVQFVSKRLAESSAAAAFFCAKLKRRGTRARAGTEGAAVGPKEEM